MAGLKKPKRQKDTGSPNLVLVLFLIMFVLSNIILGLWLYFTYKENDQALAKKTAAEKTSNADRKAMEVYQLMVNEMRGALGQQLTQDELTDLDTKRKAFLDD